MTTNAGTIKRAMRLLGLLPSGGSPTSQDTTDCLEALQGLLTRQLHANWLADVDTDADYTAGEDERIRITTTDTVEITLPETVTDAVTGETRPPRDGARVQVIGDGVNRFYLYDSDAANWSNISSLVSGDNSPLSADLDEPLAALLAVRIAPEYGVQPSPVVLSMAEEGRQRIAQRFAPRIKTVTDAGLLRRDGCWS